MERCKWAGTDELYCKYHDNEWGEPVHDDNILFEFLILEGAQAGLSWITVLRKRENYRKAFDDFNYNKIAEYTSEKIEELMNNEGIIRNRLKITSAIINAKEFIKIREEFGTFDKYIWGFTEGKTIYNDFKDIGELPASTPLSDIISKDMKKRGFKFVGSTIIYAFLQAVGIVNDHTENCFKYHKNQTNKR